MLDSFFFFVGGIQPKVKVLEETPRRCPRCGLHQAYLKRVDHYLSFFFIPMLRIKTGEPVLICNRCERSVAGSDTDRFRAGEPQPPEKTCRFCGKDFPAEYTFCPVCGRQL